MLVGNDVLLNCWQKAMQKFIWNRIIFWSQRTCKTVVRYVLCFFILILQSVWKLFIFGFLNSEHMPPCFYFFSLIFDSQILILILFAIGSMLRAINTKENLLAQDEKRRGVSLIFVNWLKFMLLRKLPLAIIFLLIINYLKELRKIQFFFFAILDPKVS